MNKSVQVNKFLQMKRKKFRCRYAAELKKHFEILTSYPGRCFNELNDVKKKCHEIEASIILAFWKGLNWLILKVTAVWRGGQLSEYNH